MTHSQKPSRIEYIANIRRLRQLRDELPRLQRQINGYNQNLVDKALAESRYSELMLEYLERMEYRSQYHF